MQQLNASSNGQVELQHCVKEKVKDIATLKAKLISLQKTLDVLPIPLPSDVADSKQTSDEVLLQKLCYMATGINQLLVGPDGGIFTLGNGDASLEFPSGAVAKETSVRYAIILHGPFVFPDGYKPGSVVVYFNMDGATLKKPVRLLLSHWCSIEKGDGKNTLMFVFAPHTLKEGQKQYAFEEQEKESNFTSRTNAGVLTIRDPHCLYCVMTNQDTIARYSAIAFSRYLPSEETVFFRIQLMCDSLEWNQTLTAVLGQGNWENAGGGAVSRFQYADDQQPITSRLQRTSGPGWEAAILGEHEVPARRFLEVHGRTREEIIADIMNDRFPPYILYQIIYTGDAPDRVRFTLVTVHLDGANVPLSFNCRIREGNDHP